MLVLARKKNESILITVAGLAEPIRVTLIEIRGSQVRLGVQAPRNVAVHRDEVQERIDARTNVPGRSLAAGA